MEMIITVTVTGEPHVSDMSCWYIGIPQVWIFHVRARRCPCFIVDVVLSFNSTSTTRVIIAFVLSDQLVTSCRTHFHVVMIWWLSPAIDVLASFSLSVVGPTFCQPCFVFTNCVPTDDWLFRLIPDPLQSRIKFCHSCDFAVVWDTVLHVCVPVKVVKNVRQKDVMFH